MATDPPADAATPDGTGDISADGPDSTKTAFVLAGGGAKGAFEAGAVTYLIEEEGIYPEVITGTSAGALCAAVLAQARTRQEMALRARELHEDLLAMTRAELLFGKQPWVAALEGTFFGRFIDHWVVERTRPPVPGGAEWRFRGDHRRGRKLWLLGQVARALPKLGRAGRRLRGRTGSLLTLDPLAALLRNGGEGISPIDPALVARPGVALRIAVVALGAGVLRYVTEDGTIVSGDAVSRVPGPAGGPVDLVDAVIASSSVPMVFPPRAMAGDAYVDGGVVENVPVAAAAALGASRIFAILAVPIDPPEDPHDYSRASAPAVFLRAVGAISFAERQRANLAPSLPPGTEVVVIDPRVDVVGPFDLARGLMLLNTDYGWMRAADVCAHVDPIARRKAANATDAIALARTRAWHLEEAILSRAGAEPSEVVELASCKRTIRDGLNERKGLGLSSPDDAPSWWCGYEMHDRPMPPDLPSDLSDFVS